MHQFLSLLFTRHELFVELDYSSNFKLLFNSNFYKFVGCKKKQYLVSMTRWPANAQSVSSEKVNDNKQFTKFLCFLIVE